MIETQYKETEALRLALEPETADDARRLVEKMDDVQFEYLKSGVDRLSNLMWEERRERRRREDL